jgi:hypothetical protein
MINNKNTFYFEILVKKLMKLNPTIKIHQPEQFMKLKPKNTIHPSTKPNNKNQTKGEKSGRTRR